MDIEKLIHCLQCCVRVDAHNVGCDDCGLEYCGPECQQLCGTAATALSTLQAENEKLRDELEQVKRDLDAAVKDMEALMWFSGEGCHICAHEIVIHKEPYVRSECALGNGAACCPTWRGIKED